MASLPPQVSILIDLIMCNFLSGEVPQLSNDIPESVIEGDSSNQASIALALTALVARPTFGEFSFIFRFEIFPSTNSL